MPKDGFEGSMVATMSLSSNGECTGNPPNLDPVCVKSPTHRTYQYTLDDGSVWQANCETTYENCDDSGTENCIDFMITPPMRQVVSSWEEAVQDGCATCYQTITQYSDGIVEFSDLHGCDYSGCGEAVDNPWDEVVQLQDGCKTCYQSITHHSDGTDTYSSIYGCNYSECYVYDQAICSSILSMYNDSFKSDGSKKEQSGFIVEGLDGKPMFILNSDINNTASNTQPPDAVYLSQNTGYAYFLQNGIYYKIISYIHTHPNTGIDPATGLSWVDTPSDQDFQAFFGGWGTHFDGIVLSANGHVYKYYKDASGNNKYDDLGDRNTWINSQCN